MKQFVYRLSIAFLLLMGFGYTSSYAAEFCSDTYAIDVTLPNQARWDMCWELRDREGIVLHHIHYTPRNGTRHMVMYQAALAQIHVPYDDNGARYHDVTDYGLGRSNYLLNLSSAECTGGQLTNWGGKNILCRQTLKRDAAFSNGEERLQGDALNLFSMSAIGAYNYIPQWRFFDDGSIEPSIGATGSLQRFGSASAANQGWLIANDRVGLGHLHNFFWRLDFDLGSAGTNDWVEEFNYTQNAGKTTRAVTRFTTEAARSIDPTTLRTWRVGTEVEQNGKNLPISYDIRLPQANQRDTGPATEPFTHNDIYITKQRSCELFASHNPTTNGCASNASAFVNGESLANQDLVVWASSTFYHMPRAEDAPHMDAHWSSIRLTPRDWHDVNPLSDSAETSTTVTPPEPPTNTYSNNGTGITINGTLNDWSALTSFPTDPNDIVGTTNTLDWTRAWAANDSNKLYFAYQTNNAISNFNWGYQAYLDTDSNTSTGYKTGAMGAEYLLEGKDLWRYTGTGTDWTWVYQGTATVSTNANTAEISLNRSWLGNTTQLRVMFWGNNASLGANGIDAYPDGINQTNATVRYFNYKMYNASTPNTGINNPVTSLAVDGNLADWAGKTAFGTDAADMSGINSMDLIEGWMANSSNTLYLAYRTKNTINASSWWGYHVYLDTDNNSSTGYQENNIGADYLLEGNTLWRYTGTGTTWNWNTPITGITAANNAGNAEFSIPRSSIGNPTQLRTLLRAQNKAVGGTVVDNYPETTATPSYFNYRF